MRVLRLACSTLVAAVLFQAGCAHAASTLVARASELRTARYVDAPALRRVEAGTSVELLGLEAGWVNVRVGEVSGWMRATGLAGDGATVAALARLETGRSASGNIVVAAGIRRIPKASRHALVIGVSRVAAGATHGAWPGVAHDVAAARAVARTIGVPDDNVDVVEDRSADEIEHALDALARRIQPGDQVLLYFSGPGSGTSDGSGACAAAWVGADGRALPTAAIVGPLRGALTIAGKVLVVSDTAYAADSSAHTDARRKTLMSMDRAACTAPTQPSTMALVQAALAAGAPAANIAHLQSAAGAVQGLDDPLAGGMLTQGLLDCVQGDAVDLDASGSITVAELADCIDRRAHDAVGPGAATQAVHLADASGNTGYVPAASLPAATSRQNAGSQVPAATASNGGITARSAASALADVLAQRDDRIKVELRAEPSTLAIGRDFLDVRVRSSHAGFVYLILLGSDERSFYVLFPNDLDRDNHIGAGETLQLPRPQWRVQSQGPAGRDVLLAVVSEAERDVRSIAGRKAGPFSDVLTDLDGRVQLQWLLGRSAEADTQRCVDAGRRRNLQVVKVCSDAFGAARVDVIER